MFINKPMNFNDFDNKYLLALTLSPTQLYSAGFIVVVVVQLHYASTSLKFSLILFEHSFCPRYGFAWQGFGSGGAIGVASVRSFPHV